MLNIEIAFIRSVGTSPEKVIFVASNQQLTNLAHFCTDPRKFCIIGVDLTYNVVPCYVALTTNRQLQFLTKKGEHPVVLVPVIIHTRKEYGSDFNLRCKLIQHKSTLNKIIAVGSDSEKNVCHLKS